jgi:murein DD-endopeptidase MepM/ murein hydrolase activator NlpD
VNIILVSGKLTKARNITLALPHLLLAGTLLLVVVVALAFGFQYVMLRYASHLDNPFLDKLILSTQQKQNAKMETYLRENLDALAIKLGQMQAGLLRLDTLGERLAKTAGFKPEDFMFDQPPAQGGAVSTTMPAYELSMPDLDRQVTLLSQQLDDRSEKLGVLDSMMIFDNAKKKLMPSNLPVQGGWYSSNFGWRIDPFTGLRAFHEGMDFMAEIGEPVHAAAGGVVVYSDLHPQYGNMIEIDHGNGLSTRYAHMSKRLVKVGDVVLSGEEIGKVGATGRATGPHLHFEVRQNGAPLNPAHFLKLPG